MSRMDEVRALLSKVRDIEGHDLELTLQDSGEDWFEISENYRTIVSAELCSGINNVVVYAAKQESWGISLRVRVVEGIYGDDDYDEIDTLDVTSGHICYITEAIELTKQDSQTNNN